jgi:hypothetical protein
MNQTIFLKSPGYPEGVGVSPLGGHRGKQNFSVTKGKLLGIATKLPTKSRQANSSVGYFDLNGKTILSYNLKHYLRLTTELQKTHSNALRSGAPNGALKATPSEFTADINLLSSASDRSPSVKHFVFGSVAFNSRNDLKSKILKRLGKASLPVTDWQVPVVQSSPCSMATNGALAGYSKAKSSLAAAEAKLPTKEALELPWTLTKKQKSNSCVGTSKNNLRFQNSQTNKVCSETEGFQESLLPHEIKKTQFQKNTWTWLSWSIKNNSPITGRIARSLQRAGLCVLVGGFTAFLPYKEYSIRNKIICAKEAELQSFQILNLKRSNLNCVLSKDRVTYKYDRTWKPSFSSQGLHTQSIRSLRP